MLKLWKTPGSVSGKQGKQGLETKTAGRVFHTPFCGYVGKIIRELHGFQHFQHVFPQDEGMRFFLFSTGNGTKS